MRIIAGKFKGRMLVSPTSETVRPTSDRNRESLFNILEYGVGIDFHRTRVLDLFAGTGALGIEALSRGASAAVFVEQAVKARAIIHQNIEALALEGCARILRRDATDLGDIGRLQPFNLVFADPPYAQGLGDKALANALAGGWLAGGATLVLEESRAATLSLPVAFERLDERYYGSTCLYFYRYKGSVS